MEAFADAGGALRFRGGGPAPGKSGSSDFDGDTHNGTDENYTGSTSSDLEIFFREWMKFTRFWDRALQIYQPVETCVIALGLFGNVLALLTLLRSRRMSTPSFIYHRVLVGADLAFCITYFVHLLVKNAQSIPCNTTFYRSWFGAYFTGTVNPAVNHICGYVIMYMTLVIALDRFLALLLFERYRHWNTKKVACIVTLISLFLSVCVHCWAYFTHGTVVAFRLSDKLDASTSIISKPCWTDPPVAYHWTKRENASLSFVKALKAKDYYNGAVRVGYPICLCTLTLGVLISFAKRQKKRRRESSLAEPSSTAPVNENFSSSAPMLKRSMTSASSSSRKISAMSIRSDRSGSVLSSVFSFSFGFGTGNSMGMAQQHNRVVDRLTSPSLRHRQRCERALFYLMISVVLLAFIQVASSESRRILSLIFPPDEVLKRKVLPAGVPMEERLANFRFLLYGHQATRILANLCTAIDRSFICFLYIAMNNLFRRELLSMLNGALCVLCVRYCPQRASVFADRQDSDRRSLRGGLLEPRLSSPPVPPPPSPMPLPSPSASPTGVTFPGTIPLATDRGYAQCRFLGENLALLENAAT